MKKLFLVLAILAATVTTSHAAFRRISNASPVARINRLDELCSLAAMLSYAPPGEDAKEKLSAACYEDVCDVTGIIRDTHSPKTQYSGLEFVAKNRPQTGSLAEYQKYVRSSPSLKR